MRCWPSVRRGALTGAVAIALATAAAGCGREGDLVDTPEPPSTATTSTEPATAETSTTGKASANAKQNDPFAKPSRGEIRLRNTAVRYARKRFGVATRSADVTLRRSRRSPAWVIASAAERRTLWVVWLKDGEVALATDDVRRFDPPSVPCDVRPAFSEPDC